VESKAEKQEDSESDSRRGNEMFVAKVGLKTSIPISEWIIDSGASRHMTFEKNIKQYKEFKASEPVGLGDAHNVEALGELVKSRLQLSYTMVRALVVG